jgi:tetratricopeptide (TPR) repeat protein
MAENNVDNVDNVAVDFMVVWLDNSIEKTKQNRDTEESIRETVRGRLKTYGDPNECVDYITDELATKRVFLIISNFFGKHVVPLIYQSPYIQGIYVYCGNRKAAEEWAKPNLKISGIFIEKNALINKIKDDVRACDKDSHLPMSVFYIEDRQKTLRDLAKECATFMWYQLLIIVLRHMAKFGDSKSEMIDECRTTHINNEAQKKVINEFNADYVSPKAVWWYTRDCFVYRLLNKSLRTQDTENIFKFRFFINDLHNQIEQLYLQYLKAHRPRSGHRLTVYRGQSLNIDELNTLKRSVDGLISMNSFLSATLNRDLAVVFAGTNNQPDASSPMQSVLFIIDVEDMSKETTPFAPIKSFSCFEEEDEVLFTIGAIFKVQSVEQHENMWHVQLQLSKQQNELYEELSKHMMKQIGSEPSPSAFGWFLYRTSEFDKAERFAQLLLQQLPPDHKEVGHIYNLLGLINKDRNRLQQAVDCYEKALEVFSHGSQPDSPQVIATHYNTGMAYLAIGDNRRADVHLQQAKGKLYTSSQSTNPLLIAMTDVLKGKFEAAQGDCRSALTSLEMALSSKKKSLPATHPSIASTLNEIGIIEEKMGHDETALGHFTKARDICQKILSSNHMDFAEYETNIGRIHYKRKEYALALKHFELALNVLKDNEREDNDQTVALMQCIADTTQKLK